ncbi:MAG: SAM-dependent methyltransferase [Planctomycetia bacterium]|nr:SAM-dependent methyltransferase [Planctomycetia bacterium]
MPFLFVTSQVGAEPILKEEIVRQFPDARLAFSRPGLLTFKLPEEENERLEKIRLKSVFARSWGFSLGMVQGKTPEEMIPKVWEWTNFRRFDRIHVWGRDTYKIGDYQFEPALTDEANELCWQLCQNYPHETLWRSGQDIPARQGDWVLDCILVHPLPPEPTLEFLSRREKNRAKLHPEKQEWLIGYHQAHSFPSTLPGGMLDLTMPPEVVSRAWLKMEEALRWSNFPIEEGSQVCEIGSAPGGATQALLSRGCHVLGVDPAEMAPEVLENPRFRHIRSKVAFVKRREFRKVRWLTCDINVPPNYTLDVVESLVLHPDINLRGMLLTLKFPDWSMGHEVENYLDRIRSWGFPHVHARQLHYSHQEICVRCDRERFL